MKYDKSCCELKNVQYETMEEFMYTYLNQKYGLKSLVIEQAASIINGIKTYLKEDHEVALFAKILKNQCEEDYRHTVEKHKVNIQQSLRYCLREKNPFKSE